MAVTLNTVADRVAQKLGILAVGDVLSAEDGEVIRAKVQTVRDQLSEMEIVSMNLTAGIRDSYVAAVVDMAAAQLVDEYGLPEPRRSQIRAEGLLGLNPMSPAERWMRKVTRFPSAGGPVSADYY